MQGTVKFFNSQRGFGFIQPDEAARTVEEWYDLVGPYLNSVSAAVKG